MKTFKDTVTDNRSGFARPVVVEWDYNPITAMPVILSLSAEGENIYRYAKISDVDRIEAKIDRIASDLTVEQRTETIKQLMKI